MNETIRIIFNNDSPEAVVDGSDADAHTIMHMLMAKNMLPPNYWHIHIVPLYRGQERRER